MDIFYLKALAKVAPNLSPIVFSAIMGQSAYYIMWLPLLAFLNSIQVG